MLKILQITPSYKPAYIYGGTTASVSKLCEELVKSRLEIEVLTTNANGESVLQTPSNLPCHVDDVKTWYFKRLTKDHSHFSPALLWNLRKQIKSHHKQHMIIHIHSWWNTVAIFSLILAIWYRIPVILSPRGMLTPYTLQNKRSLIKKLFHKVIGIWLLKQCIIHATSEKEMEDLYKIQLRPKDIYIIPNFINCPSSLFHHDLTAKNPGITTEKNAFRFLFLSRIEEKKGIDLLFKALSRTKFAWTLSIAGQGSPDYIWSLKNLSFHLNIHQHINWAGYLNQQEKFDFIQKHDLLVLPSQNENFANVVIESLASGTPVLLTREVGLAAYVLQHDLGWICKSTITDLTHTLYKAYKDIHKRSEIRKYAPKQILNDFSAPRLTILYQDMYQQTLKNAN
ncbi:XrtY-associated glycosyltransferase XYAG1 [Pedobacter sp.]|jgi:glycosyltransferase involved in cell wall biosynthesis|uniref:XrtY-associated glycosyltransferase XYAG1 n=1 Tax=Pedobacter sp. TaxID=1411316 RepID=UPI002BCD67D2|nr:glycosyltransferase [Pedobacter sp.]HWW40288.1 glycosyltransferase [Pedobacter sp.]